MPDAGSWVLCGAMEMRIQCDTRDNVAVVPNTDWKKDASGVSNHEVASAGAFLRKVEMNVPNIVNRCLNVEVSDVNLR